LDCKNPTGELRGDASRGKVLYAQTCVSCHGAGGKGDGPAAPKDPPPADHTDPVRMGALTDADIYTVICGGGAAVGKSPLMAAWGPIVQDQGLRDLVAYIRTLAPAN
jgi:mono/diheme cytochrome c family protein